MEGFARRWTLQEKDTEHGKSKERTDNNNMNPVRRKSRRRVAWIPQQIRAAHLMKLSLLFFQEVMMVVVSGSWKKFLKLYSCKSFWRPVRCWQSQKTRNEKCGTGKTKSNQWQRTKPHHRCSIKRDSAATGDTGKRGKDRENQRSNKRDNSRNGGTGR